MFDVLRYLIGYSVWFFVIGLALWRGGKAERQVATILLVGVLATPLVLHRPAGDHVQLNLTLVDATTWALLMWPALRSDRWWPLAAAAAALIMVLTDCAYLIAMLPQRLAATGEIIWSYVILFSLAGGLAEVEARRRGRGRASQEPLRQAG